MKWKAVGVLVTGIILVTGIAFLLLAYSVPKPHQVASSPLVVEVTLEELVAQASHIVVGEVIEKKSQWSDDRSHIYTLVTVSVEEWVKGDSKGNKILIKVPGGKVGEVIEWVEDVASFRVGERVVVFLHIQEDSTFDVVGGWQGKFTVENGKIVGSDLSLAELIYRIEDEMTKVP